MSQSMPETAPENFQNWGYAQLSAYSDHYLHGVDEVTPGETPSDQIFASCHVLTSYPLFKSPEEVAQGLLDGILEVMGNSQNAAGDKQIILIHNKSNDETLMLYAPEKNGVVENGLSFSLSTGDRLSLIGLATQDMHLILSTPDDFVMIRDILFDPEKPRMAKNLLSHFSAEDGDGVNILVENILARARRLGASDVHVQPTGDKFEILIRLHGLLQPIPGMSQKLSRKTASAVANVLTNFSGEQLTTGSPLDGAFRYVSNTDDRTSQSDTKIVKTDNKVLIDTDYRVSLIPLRKGQGYSSVVRLLMRPEGLKTLNDLGYDPEDVKQFREVGELGSGICIVSGPTGSGKTTTLYSLLADIHDSTLKTLTIENPAELQVSGIVQSEVNEARGYGFSDALRRFLRHDPDRILIGETRDSETAKTAIDAANTGHLVLTTIHANSAAECIRRLINLGVGMLDICSSVQYLFAQRLVPRLSQDDQHAEWYDGTHELESLLKVTLTGTVLLRRPKNTVEGIVGRLPIFERIEITPTLRDLLETRDQVSTVQIERIALEEGFVPMEIAGLKRLLLGETSLAGLKKFVNPARLRQFGELALAYIEQYAIHPEEYQE